MLWYRTSQAKKLLEQTSDGRFVFLWEAEDIEGQIIRQFDPIVQERALSDPEFAVPFGVGMRLSVDFLDRERVKRFTAIPTAIGKKLSLYPLEPVTALPNLEAGQRFKSYWLVDREFSSGFTVCRTVVGIERLLPLNGDHRFDLTVISPSGSVTKCHSDNQSYEGE